MILAVLAFMAWAAAPAEARSSVASGPSGHPRDEDRALELLAEANEAAAEIPYEGLRFVSAWTAAGATTSLVRLTHRPRRGTTARVVGTGADKPSVRYERPEGSHLPGCGGHTLDLLGRNYELAVAGLSSVAERPSHVVEARRGNGSLAARFWLDRDTGLMIRREIRGRHGRVVRTGAFIDLNVGAPLGENPSAPSAPAISEGAAMLKPWQQRLRSGALDSLRSRGWALPRKLPPGLALIDARRGVLDGRSVVHLSYSDGLSSVSLFVQRGALAADRMNGWHRTVLRGCCTVFRQHTLPRRVVWSADGRVYTVVAHAPPGVVEQVVAALPHDPESRGLWGGFWGRMARGFTALGSWLNPFG